VINVSYSNTQREINQDQPGLTAAKIMLSRRRHSDGGTVSAATPVPRLSPAQRVPAGWAALWQSGPEAPAPWIKQAHTLTRALTPNPNPEL